ncbi:hypothetical protein P879_03448 [Paragonimus westermani]|uniref:Hepatocyte growth factor-regulated tyrosine kinase substrate helical domain-containing protein n=1 Tax=Paragonimus westermani TaxID=34504 RepID=A0A8T0DPL4_9TREM|nr:hypothetical protein P879_03448 [Paragonimus westermani]
MPRRTTISKQPRSRHRSNPSKEKPNTEKKPQSNSDEQRRGTNLTSQKPIEPNTTRAGAHAERGPLQLLPVLDTTDMDPELARYLNRHYWENRANAVSQAASKANHEASHAASMPQPSAPIYSSPVPLRVQSPTKIGVSHAVNVASDVVVRSGNENNTHPAGLTLPGVPELTTSKQEEFLNALQASIEFFVNRLQSNSLRGRSIANDTTVQALFLTLHEMHPQLLQCKQGLEDRRAYFEGLQDKLTQLREAREALDALRQEHVARRQLKEQEAARLRQLQMMQKLELMRQQKRDALEYQRRMAMEQTMQYQQQYQQQQQHSKSQPFPSSVDPSTGLPTAIPIGTSYPMTYPNYPMVGLTPPAYDHVTGVYEAGGGQAGVDSTGSYYQGTQSQNQPIYAYPSQIQSIHQPPNQSAAAYSSTGPYSMQQLETALPSSAEPLQLYHQPQSGTPHHLSTPMGAVPSDRPSDPVQQTYTELPGVSHSVPQTNSSSAPALSPSQTHQGGSSSAEGQLISFD